MLRVASLRKSYFEQRLRIFGKARRIPVLDGVSFEVCPGEVVALLGANGAGKTTILHLIAGLTEPDSGTVELDGNTLNWRHAREVIGLGSSADRSFYYRLTLRENLEFFGRLYGLAGKAMRSRVDALLQMSDLCDVAGRRYAQCSTGMRQRLSLARALLHDPPVLLLDEPTRAIDPLHAQRFRQLVRDELANTQRKTVVLATNLLEEAWSVADRIVLLNGGRGIAVDTPTALARRMMRYARYRVALEHMDTSLVRRLETLGSVDLVGSDTSPELVINIATGAAALHKMLFEILQSDQLVRSISLDGPAPDELFGEGVGR